MSNGCTRPGERHTINGGKVQFPTMFRNANTTQQNFAERESIAKVSEAAKIHRKNCRKSRLGHHGMKPAGSINDKSAMKLSTRQPSSKSLPAKRILGQYFLDFGQRDFTYKTCRACGLVYAAGLDEDEKVHAKYHKNRLSGIAFQVRSLPRSTMLFR